MSISPQGYSYGVDPKSDNPFWVDVSSNVTIEEKDGDYTLYQGDSEIGKVETGNLVAETVLSQTSAYDVHTYTMKETERNGTQNDVGSFILPTRIVTNVYADGENLTVESQSTQDSGDSQSDTVAIPGVKPSIYSKDLTAAGFTLDTTKDGCCALTIEGQYTYGTPVSYGSFSGVEMVPYRSVQYSGDNSTLCFPPCLCYDESETGITGYGAIVFIHYKATKSGDSITVTPTYAEVFCINGRITSLTVTEGVTT